MNQPLTAEQIAELRKHMAPAIPRQLTKVTLKGVEFFLDDKLGELREVNNPHNVIKL